MKEFRALALLLIMLFPLSAYTAESDEYTIKDIIDKLPESLDNNGVYVRVNLSSQQIHNRLYG